MPHETQHKFFLNLLRVIKGKLTLGPLPEEFPQRIIGKRHFLRLVVLILNTMGAWGWSKSYL